MGGKTSSASKNKWMAKAYDRINLTVPKGKKDVIQAHAQAMGESVNGLINRAIDNQISQDCGKGPSGVGQGAPEGETVSLHQEIQESAQSAATAKE